MNQDLRTPTRPWYPWIVLLVVTLLKLGLMGSGLFAFEDEGRYTDAARALGHFAKGDFPAGLEEVFSTQGRPGDALIRTIPNALQFLTSRLNGVHIYAQTNTYPLFLFNFTTFVLLLWVLYRYALLLLGSQEPALLATLLYSSLLNPQLYLRHAVPYDMALLALMVVLEEVTRRAEKDDWTPSSFLRLGVLACFGCAIYPGYYPVFLLAGAILLVGNWKPQTLKYRARCVAAYAFGGFGCFGLLEGLSRVGGRSFVKELSTLSGQITQGAFDEMLIYGPRYLFEVEGIGGLVLMAGLAACLVRVARILGAGQWRNHVRVLLPLALVGGGFIAYAAAGFFLHKMVFYGRLLHQYFPFGCIAVAYGVDGLLLRRGVAGRWLALAVALCGGLFVLNWVTLLRISYPADVSWQTARRYQYSEVVHVCEFASSFSHVVKRDLFIKPPLGAPESSTVRVVLVNACVYTPPGPAIHQPFSPDPNDRLILDRPHFLSHPAYQFEGFLPTEREMFRSARLRIRLYERGE